jgi:magnesium-transporting ATPase (P-type)
VPAVDFEDRKIAFGTNYKEPPKRTPFCKLFMGALEDFMLRLLLFCAVVSIVFDEAFAEDDEERKTGMKKVKNKIINKLTTYTYLFNIGWIEGAAIFFAVFVVAFVGSYNDYKKEQQFLKL